MCEHNESFFQESALVSTTDGLGSSSDATQVLAACFTTPTRTPPDPTFEVAIQLTPTDENEMDAVKRFVICTCGVIEVWKPRKRECFWSNKCYHAREDCHSRP